MICPNEGCEGWLRKARLDVYWCKECDSAWLIKNLGYKSLEEASVVFEGRILK